MVDRAGSAKKRRSADSMRLNAHINAHSHSTHTATQRARHATQRAQHAHSHSTHTATQRTPTVTNVRMHACTHAHRKNTTHHIHIRIRRRMRMLRYKQFMLFEASVYTATFEREFSSEAARG
eukprot:3154220-Alexandrium_andersonii.AAC.1